MIDALGDIKQYVDIDLLFENEYVEIQTILTILNLNSLAPIMKHSYHNDIPKIASTVASGCDGIDWQSTWT